MSMALPPKALEDVEDAVACKLQGRVMRCVASRTDCRPPPSSQPDHRWLRYNEEVEGVVIAFKNVAIRSPKAHIFNELPTLHIGVNAEVRAALARARGEISSPAPFPRALRAQLLVFSPVRGGHLRGVINMVSSQHIGLLVLGAFNATLPANELPPPYSYSQGDEAWSVGAWRGGGDARVTPLPLQPGMARARRRALCCERASKLTSWSTSASPPAQQQQQREEAHTHPAPRSPARGADSL